jgi:hypothetical protein
MMRRMDTCTLCTLGLDHCHAPVLVHHDGTGTCVDGCGRPLSAHDDTIDCADLGPPGCCAPAHQHEVLTGSVPRAA